LTYSASAGYIVFSLILISKNLLRLDVSPEVTEL